MAERSVVLHGNKLILPVAGWIHACGEDPVSGGDVVRGLGGAAAPNKALEALGRLCTIGALEELPYVGRPHPRLFQRLPSTYWDLVAAEVREVTWTTE